ncbi:MAG: polysaccharide biosynthesis protein [Clostridiales bacterium]|nr:polysaccharide biosynthesis protein [Clostridiales bacterium]
MIENKKNKSIFNQALVLSSAGILTRFIGFLYRLPLTKLIGDEGNGIYSAGYYIYIFFLILSSSGLPVAISKMTSERLARNDNYNAHKIFRVSFMVSCITGFISMIIIFVFAKKFSILIKSPRSYYSILSLAPTIFIVAIMSVFRGYFQGMCDTKPTAISQIVEQVFNAMFSIILAYILIKKSVALGAAGGTAGTGIGAIFGLIILIFIYIKKRKLITENINLNKKNKVFESKKKILTEIFKTAVPIIIGTAIFSITNLIDMHMVMLCLEKAGFNEKQSDILYGQLTGKYVSITTFPVSIATSIATVIIPSIASSYVLKKNSDIENKINKSIKFSIILSFPAAIGLAVLSKEILLMLFPSYPDGFQILKYGSLSIIFLSITQVLAGILQGINHMKVPVISSFIGAIIKIPLNYFLISNPKINIIGAVISTTLCYTVTTLIDIFFVIRFTKIKLNLKDIFLKPLLCTLIMGLLAKLNYLILNNLSNNNFISVLFSIVFSIILYFLLLIILSVIKESDLKSISFNKKIIFFLRSINMLKD